MGYSITKGLPFLARGVDSGVSRRKVLDAVRALPGWCSEKKALYLYDAIRTNRFRTALEIGVYGGRSLVPIAYGVQEQGGKVYGIEPWNNEIAIESPTNETNDNWWRDVNLAEIKSQFLNYVLQNRLHQVISIVELASDDAALAFSSERFTGRIDLIHIDGAHSPEQAEKDVLTWFNLLKPGGMIVLDDIAWPTVQGARNYVKQRCRVVDEIFEENIGSFGAYLKE